MLKKQSSRSIDGFMPASSGRSVGFGDSRPTKKSAAAFPAIGQTLPAYQPAQAPADALRRPRQQAPRSPFDLQLDDQSTGKTKKKRGKLRSWLRWKRVVAIFFILLLGVGGWLGFKFIYNASKTFNGNVLGILSTTKLKGEDVGRVNILLAGNSADDVGHNGGELTDSIMVVSLDTKNKTAFMMSIPRDLYVNIPGYGHAKINEAYVDGQNGNFDESGYFPGGMGLLQQVIQENFGLNLNYYALVNYTALRDMVNAVGGIDINIQSSSPKGLYDPSIDYTTNGPLVKLSNGNHTLNGQQALNLARARGDAYGSYGFPASDFDRTANQRKELLALKSKIVSAGVLANPLTVSKLTDSVGKNIKTNMSISEARRAYDLGKDVSNIQSIGLNSVDGKNLLASYATPRGQSALVPAAGLDDFSDIQSLIKRITSSNPIVRENAKVVVLNATPVSGLASAAAKTLTGKDINVTQTDNATTEQAKTSIIDLSAGKMPATKTALTQLYGSTVTTTNPYASTYSDADFIVLIGSDRIPSSAQTGSGTTTSSQN